MENVVMMMIIFQSIFDLWVEVDCGVMIGMGLYVVDIEGCEIFVKFECEKMLDGIMCRVDFFVIDGCDFENIKVGF